MQQRYDTAQINKIEIDPESGFLNIKNVPIAKVGVFPYLRADGSTVMEAKLPNELLSPSTVQSANLKPVTDNHPPVMLSRDNSKQYMKGITLDNAHVNKNDSTLRVDITITDGSLISEVNDGKEELSIGFRTEIQPVSGSFEGQDYDSIQSNIQINHVAVVDRGRAGHSIRLTGDSASMIITDNNEHDEHHKTQTEDNMETSQVLLDGAVVTVSKNDADKVEKTNSKLKETQSQVDKWKAQIKELQEKVKKAESGNDEDTKKLKAKSDAMEKELLGYKEKLKPEAINDMVEKRIQLYDSASQFLPKDYDFKNKTEREIKVDAIKAVKNDFDDTKMDENVIDGIFEGMNFNKPKPKKHIIGYGGPEKKDDNRQDDLEKAISDNTHMNDLYNQFNGGNK